MVINIKNIKFLLFFLSLSIASSDNNFIDVITTNDMHGSLNDQKASFINPNYPPQIVGAAGLYKYIKDIESELVEKSDDILVLDGGNFFQGHPVGIVDSGKTIIEWMNRVGYDALVPGQNDFLFGYQNLINLSKKANFPFLGANIVDENNEYIFEPYTILEIKGVKIGIIGIVSDAINESVLDKNINGIKIQSSLKTIKEWVPKLQSMNVDVLAILTSSGVPWDREEVYDKFINQSGGNQQDIDNKFLNAIELGYFSEGVDFIISGGISKGYNTPWYDNYSHTYIFQNYGNGTGFGHFKLKYHTTEKIFIGYDSATKNNISQTLFSDDFSFNQLQYSWIEQKLNNAINIVYQDTDWNSIVPSDSDAIKNKNINLTDDWDIPSIDNIDKLDIVTWNCEFFPTNDELTINALSEAVMDLYPDIIAFQEIKRKGWFSKLMSKLPDYNFIISQQSSFMDQAIIYKKDLFYLAGRKELFAEDDYYYAGRPPLQCDLVVKRTNLQLSLINLHMKCCDSGLFRRKEASKMLHSYIDNKMNNEEGLNFIVLGDWNDDLKDDEGEHCFDPFLNDNRFFFPTLDITYDISQASYPKEPYVSFLDHILVSKSLMDNNLYEVKTIPIDKYMGNFSIYEEYISDHMPVLLSFLPLKGKISEEIKFEIVSSSADSFKEKNKIKEEKVALEKPLYYNLNMYPVYHKLSNNAKSFRQSFFKNRSLGSETFLWRSRIYNTEID